jgi:signal transduction histidine kinase
MTARADKVARLERMCRRLEHLYEISKLFARFETVEQTFDPALAIVARTLPLRSAILIQTEDARSKMIVWCSEGQGSEQMRAVKEHLEKTYAYLVGAASTGSIDRSEQAGLSALPRPAGTMGNPAHRFIVIPLVVAHRPPFGALQLEGAQPFDEADLMFVNAIANQLAIALDRDRVRRRDITRRVDAEEGRTHAEASGATSERGRIIAEGSSSKYEALAAENARLYEQAQLAVRVREQILAIVSHDLRNPVGTILMATTVLAQPEEPGEVREELSRSVGRIRRAAETMLRLIDDLLDFASIEAGSLAIKRQPQDPGSIIQETLASFEGVATKKRLRLTPRVEPNLPKLDGDRGRILQVLSNLVGNATKVTAEGGQITLRVEARGHDLLFAVSDDGPGISEENVKYLFERYWRSVDATYKGTGLGLAIARGIVNAHGGRIWVESELGHGATFLFTIPAADAAGRGPDVTASDGH